MHKPNFRKDEIRRCFLRSLCVALFLLIASLMVHLIDNTIWMTSIAASAFIAFTFPEAQSVRPIVIMGSYFSACLCGILTAMLTPLVTNIAHSTLVLSVTAVFFTTLLMTIFDFEHPPAVALSVAIVLTDTPVKLAFASFLCAIILCIIKVPLTHLILRNKGIS